MDFPWQNSGLGFPSPGDLPNPGIELSFPDGSGGKVFACNAGDLGSIPGSGRSPGEGHSNPLQWSCLENPMDGGAWQATGHGVTKSDTTKQLHSCTAGGFFTS